MSFGFELVYFVYGLAFFSLGLAMALEAGRFPLIAESRALALLAAFGLLHGFHEWLQMFLLQHEEMFQLYLAELEWLRIGWLALSFAILILFGLRMLQPTRQLSGRDILSWAGAVGIYTTLILFVGMLFRQFMPDWMLYTDAIVRYSLAIPGAFLAGIALYRRATQSTWQGLAGARVGLLIAGYCFFFYALTQFFAARLDFFPANTLNSSMFQDLVGVPVQAVRAALALVMTVGLVTAMQAAEAHRQRQFATAQQARLEALQEIQGETARREAMRQELLRHTVMAQEEERARIARELHDETSQVLTAFSLQLATLRQITARNPKAQAQIIQLQTISRHIAQGLHRLVRDLRPRQLDELGLIPALQWLVEENERQLGMEVRLEVEGPRRRLPAVVETVFFRIAQEALTNVARHAGVQQAGLKMTFTEDEITLSVLDQGIGMLAQPHSVEGGRGWGIAGMRERAESIGATFKIDSSPGQGTRIHLSVPCRMIDACLESPLRDS